MVNKIERISPVLNTFTSQFTKIHLDTKIMSDIYKLSKKNIFILKLMKIPQKGNQSS